MALTYTSSNPITVTQGSNSDTYSNWSVANPIVRVNSDGTVTLTVSFQLLDNNGNIYPGAQKTMVITDIISDPNVGSASQMFFQALISEAIAQGIIS